MSLPPPRQPERRICGVRLRRLNQIDFEIRSGTYPNCSSLAKKYGTSTRTILRDIEILESEFGAPVAFDTHKNGYYYTDPDFFFKSFRLTEGELFSLALFDQLLEQYRGTPIEENLRSIFAKIEGSLPENVTFDSRFLQTQTTFIPDLPGSIEPETFSTIFSALKDRRTLEFDYRPLQKTTYMTRRLAPYHAVCQKGSWYIIGFCHDKNEVRVFSFARMKNARETSERFTIPTGFKAENFFDKEMGVWLSAKKKYTVELLASAEIGTFALERTWNKAQQVTQHEDGSVLVRFETTQLPEVKRWVLGQGGTVRVLQPPELAAQVKEEAEKVLKMYSGAT